MIVALGHQRGVGKDTAASFLQHHGWIQVSFAEPLKEGARAVFGLSKAQITDPVLKETVDPFWGVTPRYLLQRFGTECLRHGFADDIWIRALKRKIDNLKAKALDGSLPGKAPGWFVITDLRHRHEAVAIKSWGGYLVKIHRPGLEPQRDADGNIHASETELLDFDGWDAEISNYGEREELGRKIVALVADLRGR